MNDAVVEKNLKRFWDNIKSKFIREDNIKTINDQSIIGKGNLKINGLTDEQLQLLLSISKKANDEEVVHKNADNDETITGKKIWESIQEYNRKNRYVNNGGIQFNNSDKFDKIELNNGKTLQDILDKKADDDKVVHLEGKETISGKKTFIGGIGLNSKTITSVGDPTEEKDAANKRYVDSKFNTLNLTKQDKLNPGANVDIDDNNVINCTFGLPLKYKFSQMYELEYYIWIDITNDFDTEEEYEKIINDIVKNVYIGNYISENIIYTPLNTSAARTIYYFTPIAVTYSVDFNTITIRYKGEAEFEGTLYESTIVITISTRQTPSYKREVSAVLILDKNKIINN